MTLYFGIDESIVQLKKRQQAFIYVGTFTKNYFQAEEQKKTSRKIRDLSENTCFDFSGLAGFLFGVFLFNNSAKRGENKKPEKKYKQFLSVYTLITEGLDGAECLGILDENEDVKIEIDGHDTYRLGEPLSNELSQTKYKGAEIKFIAHGDQKVKIINQADMIAYVLRGLRNIGYAIEDNLSEKGIDALLKDDNPRIKKITPFHLGYDLERRVA